MKAELARLRAPTGDAMVRAAAIISQTPTCTRECGVHVVAISDIAAAITAAEERVRQAAEAELAKAQKTIKQLCVAHSSWALGNEAGIRQGIEMFAEIIERRARGYASGGHVDAIFNGRLIAEELNSLAAKGRALLPAPQSEGAP